MNERDGADVSYKNECWCLGKKSQTLVKFLRVIQ